MYVNDIIEVKRIGLGGVEMFVRRNTKYIEGGDYLKNPNHIIKEELADILKARNPKDRLDLRNAEFVSMDLSGWDLSNCDFSDASFIDMTMDGVNLDNCIMQSAWFTGKNSLRGAKMTNSSLREVGFRYVDLTNADISGSDIYCSILEKAVLDGIVHDEKTEWFEMKCPPEGTAFIAWKCCIDLRVVQLLIPKDAKRVMATLETGRVNRAKVLSIKSVDETESYDWAQSTVDQDFFYYTGKYVEPSNGFQEDRWMDSSQGLHFFLEREQCIKYATV